MDKVNYNEREFISLNEDGTKVKIMFYYNDGSKKELVDTIESECSVPQFICDFDGLSNDNFEQIVSNDIEQDRHNFGKKLYATFFTTNEHLWRCISAYDFEVVTPQSPIKEDNLVGFYDGIYSRMKLQEGEMVKDIPENQKANYLKQIERFQTDESKQKFITDYVSPLLKFEMLRPTVKSFVDDYFEKNPQYKFARIHNF